MEGADALGLIAEVGIAIAGFSGVVAALRAPVGKMAPRTALRVGTVFGLSACNVMLAILPFALHFAGLAGHTLWALSSGGMALLVALLFLVPSRVLRRDFSSDDQSPSLGLAIRLWIAITTVNVALQLANVAIFQHLWPFFTGLSLMTAHSLVSFAYILLAPTSSEVHA